MGFRDRLRRHPADAGVTLAANPRPQLAAVNTDDDRGTLGGPTTGGAVRRVAGTGSELIASTRLTPDVVRAMRDDPQVSACLTVQALPMIRAEWTVECDDDDIRENVTAWWEKVSAEVMRSAARCLWAGYSPNILVWDVDPDTGGLYVRKVRDLDPATVRVLTQDNGDYDGMVQRAGTQQEERWEGDGPDGTVQTLWLVEGMESGNLYGRPMLTSMRQAWQEKVLLSSFHIRGLERFASPVTRTRGPDVDYVTNQADINAALAAGLEPPAPVIGNKLNDLMASAERLANGSILGLPSERTLSVDGKDIGYTYDVDYLESTHGAADIVEAIRERDRAIARGALVPSLLIEGGQSVGSNALGQSHKDTFTSNAEARLADYAGQITRHLFTRYVTLNYGPMAPPAVLSFAPLSDDDREQMWQLAGTLIAGNLIPVDGPSIAARLGIPVADVEEVDPTTDTAANPFSSVGLPALVSAGIITADEARGLLGIAGAAPEVATAAAFAARGDRAGARYILGLDRVHLAAAPANVDGVPDWQLPQSYDTGSAFRRPLTARENGAALRRLEDGMNTAEADIIARLSDLLEGSRAMVLRQVAGIIKRGGTEADITAALGTVGIGATGPYAAAWTELQRTLWGAGLDSVRAELADFADKVPGDIGRDGRALVAAYATASANRVTADLASRVQLELLNTYRSGVSRAGLEAVVSDLFDREMTSEGRPVRRTTRELAARAVNAGRRDAVERGGIPLRGAQYSALLDKRTCDLCGRLDEQVIAIGDLDFAKFTAPVHHNCRCVWVYITTQEADFTPTWESPPRSMVERFGSLVVA